LATGARKPQPFAQQGNYRPVSWMQLHDAQALPDNKVGSALGRYAPGYANTDVVYPLAFKWIRVSGGDDVLGWQSVERTPGVYTVDAAADTAVTDYARNGTTIVFTLDVSWKDGKPDLVSPRQVEAYARWVRFMVDHFRGRVGYFEILNEPDNMLTVEQYVAVIERVIPVIRATDPAARIVIGAGPGVWNYGYPGYDGHGRYSMDLAYLNGLFSSRVTPLVDVLAWHAMYNNRADDPYYRTYPQTVAQLEGVARAHGFTGQFMAAEMQWRSVNDPLDTVTWVIPYSEPVATKYFLRTTVLHRSLDFITILAPPGVHDPNLPKTQAIHANNEILAGAGPTPVALTLRSQARLVQRATFRYANGDALVALWRDGLPRDSDPGIAATLTLPAQAGRTATVLDPLRQRQQKLVTSSRNGSLVIKGLLVRDYPLFVRLR
jgi:hypothetical protein